MTRLLRTLAAGFVLALATPACETVEVGDEQNATATAGRFETFVGEDGQHYFHLLAKNGEKILHSEGYTSLSGAKKGITSVKNNGTSASRYQVVEADSGEFYFNLVATNGQVIGTSEMYASKSNAQKGVEAVIGALANATSAAAEAGGPRFETFKGADKKTYFRLRAENGQIVLQSQGYSSKSGAEGGIDSVSENGLDASRYEIFEGVNGQHTFRLKAANGKVIARGEMYVSKSNANRGADRVREILREMAGEGEASDDEIRAEVEAASGGVFYMSESDYPFTYGNGAAAGGGITEAAVRAAFASIVDADEDADKPMAELFAMESSWQEWKDAEHSCQDPEDPVSMEQCTKMRSLEQVLESNLEGIKVFYFGADGEPGSVDGIGVSVFIVGRAASGRLVGVRTLAIWT